MLCGFIAWLYASTFINPIFGLMVMLYVDEEIELRHFGRNEPVFNIISYFFFNLLKNITLIN